MADYGHIPNTAGVYCITFDNGKRYVGQSAWMYGRIRSHFGTAKTYKKCRALWSAIQTHKVMAIRVLALINDPVQRGMCESHFISRWRLQDRRFGYNLMNGGNSPRHSEETKRLCSVAAAERHARKTPEERKWSDAHKAKSLTSFRKFFDEGRMKPPTMRGRKHSEETKEKMRLAWRGRKLKGKDKKPDSCSFGGHRHSEESRKKITDSLRRFHEKRRAAVALD